MLFRIRPFALVIFFLLNLGTLILFYLAKPAGFNWSSNYLLVISQIISLIGTIYLSVSFVLSSRFSFLERLIGGLDVVYKIHHFLGAISFVLLLHHPLLLAVRILPNAQAALRYLLPSNNLSFNFGIAALFLMILLIIFTLFVHLPYHIWKNIHIWMGGVLLLAMLHVFFIVSDVSIFLPLRIWMFTWMIVGLISFIYKRFFYNRYKNTYEYQILKITEINNYFEFILSPPANEKMKYQSGQFVYLASENETLGEENHPFSIASSPDQNEMVLIIKKLGDYTSKMGLLKAGEKVRIHGPYGTFLETVPIKNILVGIAGGIGMTPFISLLKNNRLLENKKLTLFHVIKDQRDSFFNQTENLSFNSKTIVHNSTENGKFSLEAVQHSVENIKEATFYICGPSSMMESLRSQLISAGVKPSKIIFEDFSTRS